MGPTLYWEGGKVGWSKRGRLVGRGPVWSKRGKLVAQVDGGMKNAPVGPLLNCIGGENLGYLLAELSDGKRVRRCLRCTMKGRR